MSEVRLVTVHVPMVSELADTVPLERRIFHVDRRDRIVDEQIPTHLGQLPGGERLNWLNSAVKAAAGAVQISTPTPEGCDIDPSSKADKDQA